MYLDENWTKTQGKWQVNAAIKFLPPCKEKVLFCPI
jgi:hypothetical protein